MTPQARRRVFRFSSRIRIDRPLADVWRVLVDFPRVPSWERGVREVRLTSRGMPGVGTTLVARRVYGGRETLVDCRITEWEERRGATMALRGGPLHHARVRYAVEPAGSDQTVVTYSARGELIPALRLLTPLMPAVGRAGARRNLARLKRLVEATGRGAARS